MPSPKNPNARTATDRARDSRIARDMVSMQLPRATVATLDELLKRDGDGTRVAALTRLIAEAAARS